MVAAESDGEREEENVDRSKTAFKTYVVLRNILFVILFIELFNAFIQLHSCPTGKKWRRVVRLLIDSLWFNPGKRVSLQHITWQATMSAADY